MREGDAGILTPCSRSATQTYVLVSVLFFSIFSYRIVPVIWIYPVDRNFRRLRLRLLPLRLRRKHPPIKRKF